MKSVRHGWPGPSDLAKSLKVEKEQALSALRLAAGHLRFAAGADAASDLEGVLGATTKDALDTVRNFNPHVRYCLPADPPNVPPELGGVHLFILGPPRDEKFLKRTNPSKANHEGYGLALRSFTSQIVPVLKASQGEPSLTRTKPFDPIYAIPFEIASEMDFFKEH